ncbi:MAG: NAD(P)H-hydrate dehydratase [Anaerolinea sp.]|nr:NAD(P)H-hydrate dehydratase [Anaerolinea sp.]
MTIKVVSVAQMRAVEAAADAAGITYGDMMNEAGRAVANRALAFLASLPNPTEARLTFLIGGGNNGGDGLVAARILAEESPALVRLYLLTRRDDELFKAVESKGVFIAHAEDDQRYRLLTNMIASAALVIDALFGIGVTLPLREDAAKLLRAANQALRLDDEDELDIIDPTQAPPHFPRPYVIAVDCPSGLDCDTGAIDKSALPADETVTFIAAKPGLFAFPGAAAVGKLTVAPLGIPGSLEGLKAEKRTVVDAGSVIKLLPPRPHDAHKGTFGKALIIGGSVNYTGAPGLAARAAYRSGAGLVTVGAPAPTISALAAGLLEATWLLLPHDLGALADSAAPLIREEAAGYDSLLLGPGWGREKTTRDALLKLLTAADAPRSRAALGFTATSAVSGKTNEKPLPPLVIDADGLNLLGEIDQWWKQLPAETILTPHPGEMSRLAGMDIAEVQARRWEIAAQKAAEWNVVLVLKGAHTLIAHPDGRVAALPYKTSTLATAGTGDILAGLIVGLLAQGMKPFDAAICAGSLHGYAGELLGKRRQTERGTVASDLFDALIEAYRSLGV